MDVFRYVTQEAWRKVPWYVKLISLLFWVVDLFVKRKLHVWPLALYLMHCTTDGYKGMVSSMIDDGGKEFTKGKICDVKYGALYLENKHNPIFKIVSSIYSHVLKCFFSHTSW